MPVLDPAELHDAVRDRSLAATVLLNEVMTEYPDAISFAPGAPQLKHLADANLTGYMERFLRYTCTERGITRQRAIRLLHEYGPSRGIINDLVARALHLDQGLPDRPEAVVITVGAQEGMFLTLRALHRDARDLLAVAVPCYVGVLGAARLLDIGVVPIRDTEHGPDLDDLHRASHAARAAGRRIRSLYIAPDFANPSGHWMDVNDRRALLAAAEREGMVLLEDGTYGFTAPADGSAPSLKSLDPDTRVVHLGTFAKVCLPGARVGFVVADQPLRESGCPRRLLADEIAALKGMVTVNTPPLSQAVIGGMLIEAGGSLATLGAARADVYRRNLASLLDCLDRRIGSHHDLAVCITWNRPKGGFFVRMRLPIPVDTALLEESAAKHGVLWMPMASFWTGSEGDHELRLSCSYLDPGQIDEGIRRLAGFLRSVIGRRTGGAGSRTDRRGGTPRETPH